MRYITAARPWELVLESMTRQSQNFRDNAKQVESSLVNLKLRYGYGRAKNGWPSVVRSWEMAIYKQRMANWKW